MKGAYCRITCESLDVYLDNGCVNPYEWQYWRCRKYKTLLNEKEKKNGRVAILRCADCMAGKAAEAQKIKPCPFCNGLGALKHSEYVLWIVQCLGCGAKGPKKPTGEEAAESWNKRAAQEATSIYLQ